MPSTITVNLTPNATFRLRVAHWTVFSTMPPIIGTLSITEQKSPDSKKNISAYLVREIARTGMGRRFKFAKVRSTERYHVLLAVTGILDRCECTGYLQHDHCKHIDALRRLMVNGLLPGYNEQQATPPDSSNVETL